MADETTKVWYRSRTLWANAVAAVAGLVQTITGTAWIDPETQVVILGVVNLVLRIVTKTGLSA